MTEYRSDTDREKEMYWRRHKKRRDFEFKDISRTSGLEPLRPEGTFYIWVKVPVGPHWPFKNDEEWAQALLESKHVGVLPGEHFGCPGYVRLSLAVSWRNVKEGIGRIQEFSEEHRVQLS